MRYVSSKELKQEGTLLVSVTDSHTTYIHHIFTNIYNDVESKTVMLLLNHGWFDGDEKKFILLENDEDVTVAFRLTTNGPIVAKLQNIGDVVECIWISRYKKWHIY